MSLLLFPKTDEYRRCRAQRRRDTEHRPPTRPMPESLVARSRSWHPFELADLMRAAFVAA